MHTLSHSSYVLADRLKVSSEFDDVEADLEGYVDFNGMAYVYSPAHYYTNF
jgi:hypothetical protein